MMIEDGKRVATGRAGFQRHMTPIADIDLIARCIGTFAHKLEVRGQRSDVGGRPSVRL